MIDYPENKSWQIILLDRDTSYLAWKVPQNSFYLTGNGSGWEPCVKSEAYNITVYKFLQPVP